MAQLRDASDAIVTTYAGVAAEGAALMYETQRPKPGLVRPATLAIGAALANDLGWVFLPLVKPELFPDPLQSLLSNLGGVIQKHVAAGDRITLIQASDDDDLSQGVRRYARANACAFCQYMSSLEIVTHEQSDWHRNCHCVVVPWWKDNPLPPSDSMDRAADAAERARAELIRLQQELKPPGMRRRNFFKHHPDLAVNTKNISRLMRAELGLEH